MCALVWRRFTERIRELGYPTLPTYHLTPEDLQEGPEKLEHRLTNWCSAMVGRTVQGLDSKRGAGGAQGLDGNRGLTAR